MTSELTVYGSLFWKVFLSATLLPGASEILLVALVVSDPANFAGLVFVASIGNTIGSMTNWMCGRFLSRFSDRKWFPVSPRQLDRASDIFSRHGLWSLFFAWMPVVGDALTILAGILRVGLLPFTVVVGIRKFARYLVVAAAALGWAAA